MPRKPRSTLFRIMESIKDEYGDEERERREIAEAIRNEGIDGWLVVYDLPAGRRNRFYKNLAKVSAARLTMSELLFDSRLVAEAVARLAEWCGGRASVYAVKRVR